MPLNAQLTLSIIAHETSSGDLSRTLRATPLSYALAMADGTGASQAQVVWSASRSVGTSGETLNLQSLADTRDGAAVTVTFTSIKAVCVRNTHATADLFVGGASPLTSFTGFPISLIKIVPGGVYFLTSPSSDGLLIAQGNALYRDVRLAAASGTATYDIVFIGEGSVA